MIITVVSSIVSAMRYNDKKIGFGHGPKSWANAVMDQKKFPHIHLDGPITSRIELPKSGYIGRRYPVKIYFLLKSELAWTPEDHDQKAIQPARLLANDFISRCQSSPLIDEVSEASDFEFMNIFDVNASGVVLSVTLKPRNYNSVCTG